MTVTRQLGFIGTKTHRTTKVAARFACLQAFFGHPFGDDADNRLISRAELGARRLFDPRRIPGTFDAGHLHAEANTEKRYLAFARKAHSGNLAF